MGHTEAIQQAAQIVYDTKPTSAAELDNARAVIRAAALAGFKFFPNVGGSAANPNVVVQAPAA